MNQSELKKQIVQDVLGQLRAQEASILKRNQGIDKRYKYLYGTGLTDGLPKKPGFDDTTFNFVRLVPEIMGNQLMGRGFGITTTYLKTDISTFDLPTADQATAAQNKVEKDQAHMLNGRRKVDADIRALALRSINLDNGGDALYMRAAKMQSYAGFVVLKHWLDMEEKKYKIVALENPNNFWRAWSNSNFREWDWSAYISQISASKANRDYGDYLGADESFATSRPGGSIWVQAAGEDVNDLPQPMVWTIDLTGYVPGWAADAKGNLKMVKLGKETEMHMLIVGNQVCHIETSDIPQFEVVSNMEEPMNPWGVSDISDDALSINKTIVQLARSWTTLAVKSLFYKMMFKGFTDMDMPQSMDMEVQGIPMEMDQEIAVIQQPQNFEEFHRVIEWMTQAFVRVTRIGLVMFNDPTAVSNSNQALMTGMKPLTDVIEEKQQRWFTALDRIYTHALNKLAEKNIDPALTEAIKADPIWKVRIDFPSVLRKEDNAWQTLWLNLFNAGAISWSTFIEKVGPQDTSDELDRIRDDLADPVRAAIMGHDLRQLASFTINKSAGIPPWGYNIPKVTLRGDLTPQQEANMASNFGWNDGPYGSSIGPQGFEGTQANDNFINSGELAPGPGGVGGDVIPSHAKPQASAQPANPIAAPGMNTPGSAPVSQPGSGAPAVSPQGAVNMQNQRQGK